MNSAERAALRQAVDATITHTPSRTATHWRDMSAAPLQPPPSSSSSGGPPTSTHSYPSSTPRGHRVFPRAVPSPHSQRHGDATGRTCPARSTHHSHHDGHVPHHSAHRREDHHSSRHRSRHDDSSDDDSDLRRDDRRREVRRPRHEAMAPRTFTSRAPLTPVLSSEKAIASVRDYLPRSCAATCVHAFDAKLIEILYCLSPTTAEREMKLRVIDDIRNLMMRTGLDVQIYGSLCTGLVIPASDVDCVLMGSADERVASAMAETLFRAMHCIASASVSGAAPRNTKGALTTAVRTVAGRLRNSPHFTDVNSIAHAKVPIVKCRHRNEGLKVDLSFEKDGCVSSNYLCEAFCEPGNEMARPLIVLVKALLNAAALDDPSIGGLGSFPISVLVLWYVRHRVPTRVPPELQRSVGTLLGGFLKYYSSEFDFRRQGIDYTQQTTFAKAPADDLFVMNPIRPGTNCAKAATFFATRVVPLFKRAAATCVNMFDKSVTPEVMEWKLLHYFAATIPGGRSWEDVSRRAAEAAHLPQNMWDTETNMYVGGVL